jgi:transcriptional regulator with XRE-family HTH domain
VRGFSEAALRLRKKLGLELRRLRNERDISLAVAAGAAHVHAGTLQGIEAGTDNPTVNTLIAICGAYGKSLAEVLRVCTIVVRPPPEDRPPSPRKRVKPRAKAAAAPRQPARKTTGPKKRRTR